MSWLKHRNFLKETVSLVGLFCLLAIPAQAQTGPSLAPQKAVRQLDLAITWKGYSLVPTAYEGRILSSGGAPIVARLQAFENGRPVSLSGYDVEWRSNGIPYLRGDNKTEFRFVTESYPPPFYVISATVREGRMIAGTTSVEVPVATRPKIVVSASYPNKIVPQKDVALQALPYFFSVKNLSDLSFSWNIAGTPIPLENLFSNFATFSFDGVRERVAANVTAQNKAVPEEKATATTYVDVQ